MGDGSITVVVDFDTRQAEADLARLNKKIEAMGKDLAQATRKRDDAAFRITELQKSKASYDPRTSVFSEKEWNAMYDRDIASWQSRLDGANSEVERLSALLAEAQSEAGGLMKRLASPEIDTGIDETNEDLEHTEEEFVAVGEAGEQAAQKIGKSTKDTSKNVGTLRKHVGGLGKRLLSMLKAVFIFQAISGALRSLKQYFMQAIMADDELSASLARLKGALRTAVQPIVSALLPALRTLFGWLSKVAAAVANLISSLFGTTIDQSAAAAEALDAETDALDGVGGGAAKAAKQMASFDEINQLSSQSGGGGGASKKDTSYDFGDYSGILGTLQEFMDTAGITEAIESLKTAFDNLRIAWGVFVQSPAYAKIKELLTFLAGSIIKGALDTLTDTINLIADLLSGDWLGALNDFKNLLVDITLVPLTGITKILDTIFGTHMTENLQLAIKTLREFNIKEWLTGIWQDLTQTWQIIKLWWQEKVKPRLDKIFEPLRNGLNFIKTDIKVRITALKATWASIKAWYETNVKPKLEAAFAPFREAWETISTFYNEHIKEPVKEAAAALGEAFSGAFETALSGIKSVINGILGAVESAINWLINAMNKISFDIPNEPLLFGALSGRHVGVDLQPISIPRLAQGAVIPPNKEFLAVLGDQKSGTNVEAPLDTIVAAVRAAIGSGSRTVVLELDRRELGRAVVDVYGQETKRVGLKLGGVYG